ncbi:MAG: hypothetical protein HY695_12845 [Deltaproteobacteria bacterium]|nr:hypothetical protein [Deltaproteobacteria bacterium]
MRKTTIFGLAVAGVVAVMLFTKSAAEAQQEQGLNNLLRGEYAFSGEAACLVSDEGFNADLTPINTAAPFPFVRSFSVQGVVTFKGDGTARRVVRVVSIRHPTATTGVGSASSADIEADATYHVAPDRSFTVATTALNGTVLTGPRAGQTFTIANFPDLVGLISQDHKTLTVAHHEPTIETQTYSNGAVFHRICHRSRMAIKLKNGDGTE